MSEQEAYQAGIDKLHVTYKAVWVDDDRDWIAPDLRQDPAFAWRVLEALMQLAETDGKAADEADHWNYYAHEGMADVLYAAICRLGHLEDL